MKMLLILLVTASFSAAHARTWTNTEGKSIEADFIRFEGDDKVVIKKKNKEFTLKIVDLSQEDQDWIAKKETPASGGKVTLLGVALEKGKNVIPMDMAERLDLFLPENREHIRNSNIHLYLPEGFDPAKQYNLLFVTATAGGRASDSGAVSVYGKKAIRQGWVTIAVDGVAGRPPVVTTDGKIHLLDAALDRIHEEWPASKTWKIAGAGSSGGAKAAQIVLMCLGSKTYGDHDIGGLLISGCNQCTTTDIKKKRERASKSKRGRVGVYFLQGEKDHVATPAHAEQVLKELKADNIRTHKYVEHPGGHQRPNELIDPGLEWLAEHMANLH